MRGYKENESCGLRHGISFGVVSEISEEDLWRKEVRERAEQIIREICEAYGIEIIEMEIMEEHVHLLVSFPPSRAIGELWEDGYFARTVGDRMTRDVIARYIEHHRDLEQGPAQLDLKLRS
jgi:REP element-mobilizing transposase RayT